MNGYNFFHFWTHFIDSPWKRSILIRHNQYLIWNLKMSSQNGSPELKVSSYNFFHFWPHFIDCPWKRSILIYHNHIQYENFKMSSQIGSIELIWAEIEPVTFFPHFDPISFIVQSNYQFWCATLWTLNEIFKWAPKSAQLSSINEP